MSDPKDIKLATEDKALLHAAQTGENCVEVTPELFKTLRENLDARQKDIDERYPALVEACDYETRLAIVAWVFKAIVDHAIEGGTFRYLIYDRLGFDVDAYVPLYSAGGMTISNEFDLSPKDATDEDA